MEDSIYFASVYRMIAVNFWESAKKIDEKMEKYEDGFPAGLTAIPFYFLISHATELFLKAALLKRGWTEQELKKYDYRHNLDMLLEELQTIGISVTPKTVSIINGLHPQHLTHALRYSVGIGQRISMPPPALIYSALEELLLLTRISTQGK